MTKVSTFRARFARITWGALRFQSNEESEVLTLTCFLVRYKQFVWPIVKYPRLLSCKWLRMASAMRQILPACAKRRIHRTPTPGLLVEFQAGRAQNRFKWD